MAVTFGANCEASLASFQSIVHHLGTLSKPLRQTVIQLNARSLQCNAMPLLSLSVDCAFGLHKYIFSCS